MATDPTARGDLAPGTVLGGYRLVRRLGAGGMGEVHEAVDLALDRPVALKVIAPALAADPDFRARFVVEARLQAGLDSPHVVTVHAHGETDGRLWIATTLVPGGDLAALLASHGPPPAAVAVELVAQVADGLHDAHAAGLVHRDVKPSNVLVRRGPQGWTAYVTDFGIAGSLDAGEPVDVAGDGPPGTPAYLAPEVEVGARAGVASDVWALGCLLWAVLTGRPPAPGALAPRLAPDRPAADGLNRVLRTALDPVAQRRHPSAAAFAADLRGVLADLTAPPAAPPRRRRTPSAPRRAAVAAAAVAAVAAAGTVTAYAVGRDATPPAATSADHAAPAAPADRVGASPTPGPGGGPARATGVASLERDLRRAGLAAAPAACTARAWVREVGWAEMVEAGWFDDRGRFVDLGRSAMSQAAREAVAAAAGPCPG